MIASDLEQLAEQVRAEHRAQFKRRLEQVPRVPPFCCGRCGAEHSRFRDRAHTRAAGWCGDCHRQDAREYMRRRRIRLALQVRV